MSYETQHQNSQTLAMSQPQSQQVSTLQLQRSRCQELIGHNTDTCEISVFATQPPATIEEASGFTTTLAMLFPQMPTEFWGAAAKYLYKEGFSKERLDYITDYLVKHHSYPTLTIADILGVDKMAKVWTYGAFYKEFGTTEKEGYCILEQRGPDGGIQYANTNLAKQLGLAIKRECFTNN